MPATSFPNIAKHEVRLALRNDWHRRKLDGWDMGLNLKYRSMEGEKGSLRVCPPIVVHQSTRLGTGQQDSHAVSTMIVLLLRDLRTNKASASKCYIQLESSKTTPPIASSENVLRQRNTSARISD